MSESDFLLKPIHSTNNTKTDGMCSANIPYLGRVLKAWMFIVTVVGRDYIAEFMATFILMIFGTGSIAQVVLSGETKGQWLSINLGWGFGIMFGAYIAMDISGAHMNPAVTLAMAILRKLPWKKVPGYWIVQFLAAFVSSAVVFGIYYDALIQYEGKTNANRTIETAGIYGTYPQDFVSNTTGFFDQVFGTFLLVLGILAICDSNNNKPKPGIKPLMIGLLLVAIGATFGYNCGYAVNPARDFSPRLFTLMAGWGTKVFTHHYYWFWIPVVAPMIGGVLGGVTYTLLVEMHHPIN